MALVGLNIQSSTEFTQLPQFSAYVTEGIKVKPLVNPATQAIPDERTY